MNNLQRWDIFCKVVDNFGDIGVCWRFARQLQVEHGLQIKFWIDDLNVAKTIIPSLDLNKSQQVCDGVSIFYWHENADFNQAAEVVIEAFACSLPPAYLVAMSQQQSKWVNLEYLSAEPWVEDFHAKPSPQPNLGLTRYFYFPGFTEATGGLIRERGIAFSNQQDKSNHSLKVSLFCYPHAPIHDLLTALQTSSHAVVVYAPRSGILPQIASFFGKDSIEVGEKLSKRNLTVEVLPFLSQADYDQLLRDCDINFVRGEDSWVRAIWAGKPFIWQPYFQTEATHITKLEAFFALFYADFDEKEMLWKAHQYWSVGQISNDVWNAYLEHLPAIRAYTLQQSKQLAKQTDLASKLVIFCNKI